MQAQGCFYFKTMASYRDDQQVCDRLYQLKSIADTEFDALLEALSALGDRQVPFWIPVWVFEDTYHQAHVETLIRHIIHHAAETGFYIQSYNLQHIERWWHQD